MLDLNITMLFQLANFLITLFVLNRLLIRPVRGIIAERKALMANLTGEAESFEAELTKARQDASVNREDGRQAGQKEQQALIEEAQKDAQKILGEARAKLTAEAEASLVELRSKVGNLSQQLVARVLNG